MTALALALAACGAGEPAEPPTRARPNVLLVTIDTLRADHCSSYGYGRETTPALTELAAGGVLFENAYAPMPTTGPSHATLFTARYPLGHGLDANGQPLAESHVTLAELLRAEGYETGAVVSSFPLNGKFGFDQGFALYDDFFDEPDPSTPRREMGGETIEGNFDRRAHHTTEAALAWLEERARPSERPFFLWIHYFDPHTPYAPPSPWAEMFPPESPGPDPPAAGAPRGLAQQIALYDGEIRFTDDMLRRVVDELEQRGWLADTLVAVTADHGEGLMEHGDMAHGLFLYDGAVAVPLVLRWPAGLPRGRVVPGPVSLVDLAPTILELLGMAAERRSFQGRSLVPLLRAQEGGARDVFLQRRRYKSGTVRGFRVAGRKFAVRHGEWKYIEALEEGSRELYHLAEDPGERRNLAGARRETARELSERIRAWRASASQHGARGAPVDDGDAELLEALGYAR